MRFEHVLCPIDFSEPSLRALSHALTLARWYTARLTVLHVVSPAERAVGLDGDGAIITPGPQASADAVAAELRRVTAAAGGAGADTEVVVTTGRTHEAILEGARTADLVVMGTHGRGGFNRVLLGSVTEKVLRSAPCPVLTVPASAAPSAEAVAFQRILCPIDFSAAASAALHHALSFARESNGAVTVLHALEYIDPEEPCEHVDRDIRQRREHLVEHARARLHALVSAEDTTWCDIAEVVAVGRAYQIVLQHAASWPADLICMGAQGTGGLELMLYGSNTQHVLRAARCPVLTVQA